MLVVVVVVALLSASCGVSVERSSDAAGTVGAGGSGGLGGPGGTGDASSGTSGGAASESALEMCVRRWEAQCDRYGACWPWLLELSFGDVERCKLRADPFCAAFLESPGLGLPTSAATDACVAALEAGPCPAAILNLPSECAPPPGRLANETACAFDEQCFSAYCDRHPLQPCGVCATRHAYGDVCGSSASCPVDASCVDGGTESTCGEPGGEGAACTSERSCAEQLGCLNGTCAVVEPGTPCDDEDEAGYVCDVFGGQLCVDGACTEYSVVPTGESCAGYPYYMRCEARGLCEGGLCSPPKPDGAACLGGDLAGCTPPARCFPDDVCRQRSGALCP